MIKITIEGNQAEEKNTMANAIGRMLEKSFKYEKNVDYMIFDNKNPSRMDYIYGKSALTVMIIVRNE